MYLFLPNFFVDEYLAEPTKGSRDESIVRRSAKNGGGEGGGREGGGGEAEQRFGGYINYDSTNDGWTVDSQQSSFKDFYIQLAGRLPSIHTYVFCTLKRLKKSSQYAAGEADSIFFLTPTPH